MSAPHRPIKHLEVALGAAEGTNTAVPSTDYVEFSMQKTQNQQAEFVTKALLVLLACIYLSTPFSDIALVSFAEKELRVSVYHCLATLFLIAVCVSAFFSSERPRLFPFSYEMAFLLFWFVSVAFSLLMPVAINGQLSYTEIEALSVGDTRPIFLSLWHFVHFAYVLSGISISFGSVLILRNIKEFSTLLSIGLLGLALSACIGAAQFLFGTYSLDTYPTILGQPVVQNDVLRLKGFAKEPSLFVVPLSAGLGAVTVAFWFSKSLLSKLLWLMLISLFMCVCYLSNSTTGLLGIISSTLIGSALSFFALKECRKPMLIALIFFSIIAFGIHGPVLEQIHEKLNHGSFELRYASVVLALKLGLESPVLGVGFGVVPAFDLISKIFVGTGLIGILFFAGFVASAFCRSIYLISSKEYEEDHIRLTTITLAAFCQLVFASSISGFTYQNGEFWIVVGLLLAINMKFSHSKIKPV